MGKRRSRAARIDADVADDLPWSADITPYDEAHFVTYLRLLDAEAAGADWLEVARLVLRRDPEREAERARRCWEAHLARAHWMTTQGYRRLLEEAAIRGERLDDKPRN